MSNYKVTKEDEVIIDFTRDTLLPIADEVTNFFSHWTNSNEEDALQKAFLYECRQNNIKITREVAITQYYKDLAFPEKKLDFFIFPDQQNQLLPSGIFIETKADHKTDTGITTNLDGRYQLFQYLYSSSHNPDENLNNSDYGIFLEWGQDHNTKQFRNLDLYSIVDNTVGAYIELWKTANKEKTKFVKIYQSKNSTIPIETLTVEALKNKCKENSLDTTGLQNKAQFVELLKENGITEA